MRRLIPVVAVVLLTAACSATGHTQPAASQQPSVALPTPSSLSLPIGIDTALGAVSNDMKKIANDRQDDHAQAIDCQQLGTDASAASVHKIPDPAWEAQWVKTMGEIQKSADECSSAASTGDNATMQQALTDMTAADNDIITFNQMTSRS